MNLLWKVMCGLLGAGRLPDAAAHPGAHDRETRDELARADACVKAGELAQALEIYRACASADPGAMHAFLGMAAVLVDMWDIDAALEAYARALQLAPRSQAIWSALLFHGHYATPFDARRMHAEHLRYGAAQRHLLPHLLARGTSPEPLRDKLRIGYVSPNLSRHSVGYFVEPLIRCHDRNRFEIYCYYAHRLSDDTTQRIREMTDGWRAVADDSDEAMAGMVREDRIDILVDLAGHSKGNRLGVFARKPAPVQMTWLGYPDTTGLAAVDYRISDEVADPAPAADALNSERLLRIADCFLAYQPAHDSPPVAARDATDATVFCSFNNIAKMNDATLAVWARILAAVPRSRLALKSAALKYPDTVDRVMEGCERNGIDVARVDLHGWISDRAAHLALYDGVDIALDTFPYNGTTTTCEALWMGVPVVTRAGDVHMSRVGASILQCAGLPDLVAHSAEQYADIAIGLARDGTRRDTLRRTLRPRLAVSSLLDHAGFARRIELAYEQAWAGRDGALS